MVRVRVRDGERFFVILLHAYVNRVDYYILSIRLFVPMPHLLLQVIFHGTASSLGSLNDDENEYQDLKGAHFLKLSRVESLV